MNDNVIDIVIRSFTGQYAFLSNFYRHPLLLNGIIYPTLEHAFVAYKTGFNLVVHQHVASFPTPQEAKRYGRNTPMRPDWDTVKFNIMEWLIYYKFSHESNLASLLSQTYPAVLIEGNTWHDQIWGDCQCGRTSCQQLGANNLGRLLMNRRDQILNQKV